MNNLSLARTAIDKGQVYGLILAGGQATRLRNISNANQNQTACFKSNVPVLTGSAIDYSVRAYEQMGLRNIVVLTTAAQASQIEQQVYRPKDPSQKVKMWIDSRSIGTARAVDSFIRHIAVKQGEALMDNLTFMVMGSDNPNNVGSDDPDQHELIKLLNWQLEQSTAATLGVTRIGMHSNEWNERTFATVVPDGLNYHSMDTFPSEYEEMLDRYYSEHVGRTRQIAGFIEQDEQKERDRRYTNFLSTGYYAVNGAFWMDTISPNLKHNFSDFGFHIFPAMASFDLFPDPTAPIQFQKVREAMRTYRFNAYFIPEHREKEPIYWCDVGTPLLLLLANMRGLMGEFGKLPHFGKVWKEEPWGMVGEDTEIDIQARIKPPLQLDSPFQPIGNIIGRNCRIGRFVHLKHCVIGDNVIIDEKVRLENVVVFPGTPLQPTFISKLELRNGIVAGGSIPGSRIIRPVTAEGAILFRSPDGDLVISRISKD